ncbi:hypothetical protein MHF_0358 [Mycoplasma haemofelis Ohio2]|uniref:Uncharacterized protein n=1 Tax=Mycoplasma haemofelis (strain Ohio2) TaxID=859194 RepID=F6FH32_MYCHI|nr:hypothetical protein MHF_0358 [Mycoplasma haemofelis Ohio2]
MHSLAAKGIAGFVGSAALSGVTLWSIKASRATEEPKSISKLLGEKRPDKRLLFNGYQGKTDGSQEAWRFAWKKYVGDHSGLAKNPFSLTINSSLVNAPAEFMNACKNLFGEKVLNQESEKYSLAFEYCTRDALVSDWIWVKGKQLVNSNSGNWGNLWNKYQSANKYKWNAAEVDSQDKFKSKCTSEYSAPAGADNDVSVLRILEYCSEDRPANSR